MFLCETENWETEKVSSVWKIGNDLELRPLLISFILSWTLWYVANWDKSKACVYIFAADTHRRLLY